MNSSAGKEPTIWLSGEIVTLLNKLVFPAIWLALSGGLCVTTLLRNGRIAVASDFQIVAVLILIGTVFMLWLSYRIQRVGYSGRQLVISSYWREARVPFERVEAVEGVWWYRGRMVRICLSESPFGQVVYYLPKWGAFRGLVDGPEKELSDLIFGAR